MPIVDINELEKQASQKVADTNQIQTKQIGDKTYFKGPSLDAWFDTYSECQNENQKALLSKTYSNQGLDEYGRTPAQVAKAKKVGELLKKKADILVEASKVDQEIASLQDKDFETANG